MCVIHTATSHSQSVSAMLDAATAFLAALGPSQRAKAVAAFDDEGRFDWYYIPRERAGIAFKDLDAEQRSFAHRLLASGLSESGYNKANAIMLLELVLRALENASPDYRNPDHYYFMIFGTPAATGTWGWRIDGHHLSLHFTVVNGSLIATTPTFLGSNPGEVREGPQRGLRVLGAEEDLARGLMNALDMQQRALALFEARAFDDIITTNARQVAPLAPVGIFAHQLSQPQQTLLSDLINEYASVLPADLATARLEKVRRAGFDAIRFGWAGAVERGEPHYYRVQGPTFLIEYDNTQNDANHIHTVWRDFDDDFGRDLLREHYRSTPHSVGSKST